MQTKIVQLERHVNDGLVITAHWEATKTVEGAFARVYGAVPLPAKDPNDPTFVPFEDLTEELVIEWVQAVLGEEQVAEYEASLDAQIDSILHPTTASGLPWSFTAQQEESSDN